MNPGNVLEDGYDLVRRNGVYRLLHHGVAVAYISRCVKQRGFSWWLLSGSPNKIERTLRDAAFNAMSLHIQQQADPA